MQQYDRWSRSDPITQLMKRFDLITPEFEWVHDVAREIFDRDGARAIPLLIGVIEADNSSSTSCGIGFHMLVQPGECRTKCVSRWGLVGVAGGNRTNTNMLPSAANPDSPIR